MIRLLLLLLLIPFPALAGGLDDSVGRTEVRIRSEPFPLLPGRTVAEYALPERLERLGYRRVHQRPTTPGEYFWGTDRFWVYRNPHRVAGRDNPPLLIGLVLGPGGQVVEGVDAKGLPLNLNGKHARWIEPEVLAESVAGNRARRELITLSALPERVWRPVLALEDHRFFDHIGVDGMAIARAAWENAKSGQVEQGASTITMQLVKNRDLTPKRTLDRKASEAMRALALEAEHTKEDILQAYLNTVYYGHVDGVAVHGLGTAARVFFSKPAADLTLAEAALLAAVLPSPNSLSPFRHPDAARERRDRALERMEELGWASASEVATAKGTPIRTNKSPPPRFGATHFRARVVDTVEETLDERLGRGLGFAADTTLDPYLQDLAEEAVRDQLAALRRTNHRLRDVGLTGALVAVDAESGAVLAHVGGDPAVGDDFDRVTRARRQPGSAVKPLLLLEAFEECGERERLTPATLVSDEAFTLDLPTGSWTPSNHDGRHHGVVDVRTALRHSYNLPFVRVSQWCGPEPSAARLAAAGLPLPETLPPSFALGTVEVTPMELVGAYTVFADLGRAAQPYAVTRIEKPGGAKLVRERPRRLRVSSRATAWLVRDLLRDVVENGTGRSAAIGDLEVVGKTGTTPADAWFIGHSGSVVTAVWIGRDDGEKLGLSGGRAAAPLFRAFMERAVPARPPFEVTQPGSVVERRINPDTGRRVATPFSEGETEVFRRGTAPKRDPILGSGEPPEVIR
jgi:membrane peptidoglycan carboxypeptidase